MTQRIASTLSIYITPLFLFLLTSVCVEKNAEKRKKEKKILTLSNTQTTMTNFLKIKPPTIIRAVLKNSCVHRHFVYFEHT
jgi:hypothetical protein